jgi:hypothetical protein
VQDDDTLKMAREMEDGRRYNDEDEEGKEFDY